MKVIEKMFLLIEIKIIFIIMIMNIFKKKPKNTYKQYTSIKTISKLRNKRYVYTSFKYF